MGLSLEDYLTERKHRGAIQDGGNILNLNLGGFISYINTFVMAEL